MRFSGKHGELQSARFATGGQGNGSAAEGPTGRNQGPLQRGRLHRHPSLHRWPRWWAGAKSFLLTNRDSMLNFYFPVSAGTPYAGGLFKVKLVLSKSFPSEPPKGFFITRIFHPNVASNGEICVNTLKRDWKADYGIQHILLVSWTRHFNGNTVAVQRECAVTLQTIKCLLIVPNPESALNEEAGKMLLERYDDYSARARLYTDIHAKPPRWRVYLVFLVLRHVP